MKSVIPVLVAGMSISAAVDVPGLVRIEGWSAEGSAAAPVNRCLGFVVEKDGFVLSNYANLTDPATGLLMDSFQVTMADGSGRTHTASIIGVEPTINLGILKLEGGGEFATARIANSREVEVGAKVAAVGGFEAGKPVWTFGEVAGLNTRQCYQESLTSTMFRARLPIPDGSLGGPVAFADTGEVVALFTGFKPVAEAGHIEAKGETHLLPIHLCFNIYDSIKQKRSLKSPWTGFSVRPLNEAEARFFPTARTHRGGIAIEHVWPDSPASRLGLREGDILVQFSYNRILSVADFQKWLYMYGVGHPVKLMILRNGTEYLVADYTIEERPAAARPR